MKKVFLLTLIFLSIAFAGAQACSPNITLLNQDPYPAVPGDYVKLVFQVDDISASDCNDLTFKLLEEYPLVFDPSENGVRTFSKVDYIKDFNNNILVPIKARVDENALDGANTIEVFLENKNFFTVTKTLDLEVEDTHADFEVFVEEYNSVTGALTLQILNTGNSDIEALTVEIPKQENIIVKGSNRIIVGDLDSNEYTTADFEAKPQSSNFAVNLIYSDQINIRRTSTEEVQFDSSYFEERFSGQEAPSTWSYVFLILILLVIIYIIYRIVKRKKK